MGKVIWYCPNCKTSPSDNDKRNSCVYCGVVLKSKQQEERQMSIKPSNHLPTYQKLLNQWAVARNQEIIDYLQKHDLKPEDAIILVNGSNEWVQDAARQLPPYNLLKWNI